jgi:hypothetical protein
MPETTSSNPGTNGTPTPNGDGGFAKKVSEEGFRAYGEILRNMMSRGELLRGILLDQRKDIYDSCSLPQIITPDMYWQMWNREPIAKRFVEMLPRETLQVSPQVYEDENSKTATEFEQEWDGLGQQLRGENSWYQDEQGSAIWDVILRADIESRIEQYGVILFGIDDGLQLFDPANFVTKGSAGTRRKLLYLRVFPQRFARVLEFNTDENSSRFGYPNYYELTFNDPRNRITGVQAPVTVKRVHWTRVQHICPGGDIFAAEPMQVIFNNLVGLQKLYCGSPEMYWRGAFPGLALSTHPSLGGDVTINKEKLQDMMEGYIQDLQRWFALNGMTAQSLAPQVVDPSPQINAQIEAICIIGGFPVRVFKGSERGELASTQDDDAWNDRLKHRQAFYVTPRIIVPFVDRLISLGVLPQPKGYSVFWPDLTSLSDAQKADIAAKRTAAMAQYIGGNVETVMTPLDYFVTILGMDEQDALTIIQNAADAIIQKQEEEMKRQQDLIARGLIPDPNAPPPPQVDGEGNPLRDGSSPIPQDGQPSSTQGTPVGSGA